MQNPYMEALTQGSQASNQNYQLAQQGFNSVSNILNQTASLGMKMVALLDQEEAQKQVELQNQQKILADTYNNVINQQLKQQAYKETLRHNYVTELDKQIELGQQEKNYKLNRIKTLNNIQQTKNNAIKSELESVDKEISDISNNYDKYSIYNNPSELDQRLAMLKDRKNKLLYTLEHNENIPTTIPTTGSNKQPIQLNQYNTTNKQFTIPSTGSNNYSYSTFEHGNTIYMKTNNGQTIPIITKQNNSFTVTPRYSEILSQLQNIPTKQQHIYAQYFVNPIVKAITNKTNFNSEPVSDLSNIFKHLDNIKSNINLGDHDSNKMISNVLDVAALNEYTKKLGNSAKFKNMNFNDKLNTVKSIVSFIDQRYKNPKFTKQMEDTIYKNTNVNLKTTSHIFNTINHDENSLFSFAIGDTLPKNIYRVLGKQSYGGFLSEKLNPFNHYDINGKKVDMNTIKEVYTKSINDLSNKFSPTLLKGLTDFYDKLHASTKVDDVIDIVINKITKDKQLQNIVNKLNLMTDRYHKGWPINNSKYNKYKKQLNNYINSHKYKNIINDVITQANANSKENYIEPDKKYSFYLDGIAGPVMLTGKDIYSIFTDAVLRPVMSKRFNKIYSNKSFSTGTKILSDIK